jgi:hypothetical protein
MAHQRRRRASGSAPCPAPPACDIVPPLWSRHRTAADKATRRRHPMASARRRLPRRARGYRGLMTFRVTCSWRASRIKTISLRAMWYHYTTLPSSWYLNFPRIDHRRCRSTRRTIVAPYLWSVSTAPTTARNGRRSRRTPRKSATAETLRRWCRQEAGLRAGRGAGLRRAAEASSGPLTSPAHSRSAAGQSLSYTTIRRSFTW